MTNLRKWKKELREAVEDFNLESDHFPCPRCEGQVDFFGHDNNGDFPIGEGYWKCSTCGFKITEDEL